MNRPWWTEDSKITFTSDNLPCYMCRGPVGAWCGYVGVPKSHPWFGKTYRDTVKPTKDMLGPRDPLDHGVLDVFCVALSGVNPEEKLEIGLALRVHGGITWSEDHKPCQKPDGFWWFGFDCAHAGDLCPSMAERYPPSTDVYRDQQYVVAECQSLAAQLATVKE